MKIALSTNWCNRRIEAGEAIAEKAAELGFSGLELGFRTTDAQVVGIRRRLDLIPVGSVHAFCPVPLSAPCGHPELYSLASLDEGASELAAVYVKKNIEFAADIGADALVLHAGRVNCRGFLRSRALKRRVARGRKLIDAFKRRLDALVPVLECNRVCLGLEDLPYLEGFPAEWELESVVGDWVRPWLDTGHDFVRRQVGWDRGFADAKLSSVLGVHLNDSLGGDDHLPPGDGKVDFAAISSRLVSARHLVMEPNEDVEEAGLLRGLEYLRRTINR